MSLRKRGKRFYRGSINMGTGITKLNLLVSILAYNILTVLILTKGILVLLIRSLILSIPVRAVHISVNLLSHLVLPPLVRLVGHVHMGVFMVLLPWFLKTHALLRTVTSSEQPWKLLRKQYLLWRYLALAKVNWSLATYHADSWYPFSCSLKFYKSFIYSSSWSAGKEKKEEEATVGPTDSEPNLTDVLNAWYSAGFYTGK